MKERLGDDIEPDLVEPTRNAAVAGGAYNCYQEQPHGVKTRVDSGFANFRREGVRLENSTTTGDIVELQAGRIRGPTGAVRRTIYSGTPGGQPLDDTYVGGILSAGPGRGVYVDVTAGELHVYDHATAASITKAVSATTYEADVLRLTKDDYNDRVICEGYDVTSDEWETTVINADNPDHLGRGVWRGNSNGNGDNRTYLAGFIDEAVPTTKGAEL